jgi:formyltetrahydrofolate deformylase
MSSLSEFIITLSCRDTKGIVYAVSGLLYEAGCNILDSQQFGDVLSSDATGLFFMRVHFEAPIELTEPSTVESLISPLRLKFEMELLVHPVARKSRLLLMVSKHGHCLNDLLFRCQSGQLQAQIAGVVSNHPDFADLCASSGVPFHHLPLAPGSSLQAKRVQEQQVERQIVEDDIDLIVLARYMQILSPEFCAFLKGRAINIHHSFLPSFKGAKPYYQAHERGVKLIGATAHYVTAELDEGPIIEQDVERVDHSHSPEDYTAVGRDVESVVLARAVRWHVEHRVLLNGRKTVVFR